MNLADAAGCLPRFLCQFCGAPATCYGAYEGNPPGYACDDCCGHGCEDGDCGPIDPETGLREEPES
jgi:hypothetical protein